MTQLQQLRLSQGGVSYLLLQVGGGEESIKDEGVLAQQGAMNGSADLWFPAACCKGPARTRALTHLPEPLDLLAVLGVVPVDGVLLPVIHVYLLHAAQHQLQRRRGSAPRRQPPPHWGTQPHPLTKETPQTLSTPSAGNSNNMDNTNLEHGPSSNRGPGKGGFEDPIQSDLPAAADLGVGGFPGSFCGDTVRLSKGWIAPEAGVRVPTNLDLTSSSFSSK